MQESENKHFLQPCNNRCEIACGKAMGSLAFLLKDDKTDIWQIGRT